MLKIGITGAIGSGKTTVCKIFNKKYGIPIYYADQRAKWLMTHDPALKLAIKELLGPKAYHANGRLNRASVSKMIFENKKVIKHLNEIVHPAVQKDGQKWFDSLKGKPYAIKEAALLYESNSAKDLDLIIVVGTSEKIRIKRVMKRDNITETQVKARMKNQWSQSKKIALADLVINNIDRKDLQKEVEHIHNKLMEMTL